MDGLVIVWIRLFPHMQCWSNGVRLYFLPHAVHLNFCLPYALRFPIISGTRCVVITFVTISFASTAFMSSAFRICMSNLSSIEPSVEYALLDLDVVRVDVECV